MRYLLRNVATGQPEQSFDRKKDAESIAKALNSVAQQGAVTHDTRGDRVSREGAEPDVKHRGEIVRFEVIPEDQPAKED